MLWYHFACHQPPDPVIWWKHKKRERERADFTLSATPHTPANPEISGRSPTLYPMHPYVHEAQVMLSFYLSFFLSFSLSHLYLSFSPSSTTVPPGIKWFEMKKRWRKIIDCMWWCMDMKMIWGGYYLADLPATAKPNPLLLLSLHEAGQEGNVISEEFHFGRAKECLSLRGLLFNSTLNRNRLKIHSTTHLRNIR
jgi:hypothetical protein